MFSDPVADIVRDLVGVCARMKELAYTQQRERFDIFIGDDTAAGEQYIGQPLFLHQADHFGEYGHVGSAEYTDPDRVHILLQGGIHHHLRSLPQTRVDHLHPRIAQGRGDHFRPAIMSVEPHFGDQYSDGSAHTELLYCKSRLFTSSLVLCGMRLRSFGSTDLQVSEIGFGAWAIGGGAMIGTTAIGWGDADDAASIAAIHASLDRGINFFDTADIYGLGHSEELLGKVLGGRSDIVIATKVGNVSRNGQFTVDYSSDHILQACEASLQRLKREAIDFYQLHTARMTHLQIGDCIQAMQRLQQQGKLRYWGLSLNTFHPQPEASLLLEQGLGNGFQLVLNLINQRSLPLLERAAATGCGIIARMPLQFGLLTGKFDVPVAFASNDHRKNRLTPTVIAAVQEATAPVWELCEKYGCSKTELALSYILSYPEVSTVIPGIRTAAQAVSNTSGLFELERPDRDRIESLGRSRFESLMALIEKVG
ncbi:MAG: hypothetical protein RJA57_664 [Bacteroidota bacterium]